MTAASIFRASMILYLMTICLARGEQLGVLFRQPVGTYNCPTKSDAPAGSIRVDDFVEFRKGPCMGHCPVYSIHIAANGDVTWNGKYDVAYLGEAHSKVDPTKAGAQIEEFRKGGFWSLCEQYFSRGTDQRTDYTTVSITGTTKRVSDKGTSAPEWLWQMDRKIEDLANAKQWMDRSF